MTSPKSPWRRQLVKNLGSHSRTPSSIGCTVCREWGECCVGERSQRESCPRQLQGVLMSLPLSVLSVLCVCLCVGERDVCRWVQVHRSVCGSGPKGSGEGPQSSRGHPQQVSQRVVYTLICTGWCTVCIPLYVLNSELAAYSRKSDCLITPRHTCM